MVVQSSRQCPCAGGLARDDPRRCLQLVLQRSTRGFLGVTLQSLGDLELVLLCRWKANKDATMADERILPLHPDQRSNPLLRAIDNLADMQNLSAASSASAAAISKTARKNAPQRFARPKSLFALLLKPTRSLSLCLEDLA